MLSFQCTKSADGKTKLGYLPCLLLAALLAISCGRGSGSPSLPSTDGTAAQLAAAQVEKLNALGIRILVPTYVPQGFRLKRLTAERSYAAFGGGAGYLLNYEKEGTNQVFFWIMAKQKKEPESLGTCMTPTISPLFGETLLAVQPEEGAVPFSPKSFENCPEATMQKIAYIFGSKQFSENAKTGPFYHILGKWMTPAEAVKVVESLRWLKQ